MMDTKADFVVGVNYPWRHYGQDFGTSAWGHRGFSSAPLEVQADFERIRSAFEPWPTVVVRVFIFADGRCSPEFGDSGEVVGFDDFFYPDFDAMLEAATRSDVRLIPALLDFHWCYPAGEVNGVKIAGRSNVICDPELRASFLERALTPLLERYDAHPSIFAWEVINEPEWALKLGLLRRWSKAKVDPAHVRVFIRECAELIHRKTAQRVTVGSARPNWVRLWTDAGLDFHQCHWYLGWLRMILTRLRGSPARQEAGCLIGEAPSAGARTSPIEYLRKAQAQGYTGLLFWSFRAADRYTNFDNVAAALSAWKEGK